MTDQTEQKLKESPADKPLWISVKKAVRISSICRTRLYELLNDGTLKSAKIGRKRLISYASIEALGQ